MAAKKKTQTSAKRAKGDRPQRGRSKQSLAGIKKQLKDNGVRFLRLVFTDIDGINKNVEVPSSQFDKALDGQIMFDGSSIEGFTRIEESDMILHPDLDTFQVEPWVSLGLDDKAQGNVARVICDIYNPDGTPFDGCPRMTLKRIVARAKKMDYSMMAGCEAEFFLFLRGKNGEATTETHDAAGYFDLAPLDLAEECRREIVIALEAFGFDIEAAHHEVAPGQHEIDFRYGDALNVADNLSTFRFVVRKVARDYGLHATFMPKPLYGQNGSGMHTHQSLFNSKGENVFFDKKGDYDGISKIMKWYIGGLLQHARAYCAVTNPLVNSYKRLVPGYEAPTHLAWSERNRSPLIRVPESRGVGTRCELRMPDPACNPYLALATMFAAGLDGVENKIEPPPPVSENIFDMSARQRARLKIKSLPANLGDAVEQLEKSAFMKEVLGEHIFSHVIESKQTEWSDYIASVHPWEIDRYLSRY